MPLVFCWLCCIQSEKNKRVSINQLWLCKQLPLSRQQLPSFRLQAPLIKVQNQTRLFTLFDFPSPPRGQLQTFDVHAEPAARSAALGDPIAPAAAFVCCSLFGRAECGGLRACQLPCCSQWRRQHHHRYRLRRHGLCSQQQLQPSLPQLQRSSSCVDTLMPTALKQLPMPLW